jgi:transcription elongation GreA/GreB family factor
MKARLNHLLYNDRPQTVQAVSEAAALGDRSENADVR